MSNAQPRAFPNLRAVNRGVQSLDPRGTGTIRCTDLSARRLLFSVAALRALRVGRGDAYVQAGVLPEVLATEPGVRF